MYAYVNVHREIPYVYSMLYTVLLQRISSDQGKMYLFFYKLPQTLKRLERIYLNTILLDNFLTKFLNCYEFVSSTYLTVVYSTI